MFPEDVERHAERRLCDDVFQCLYRFGLQALDSDDVFFLCSLLAHGRLACQVAFILVLQIIVCHSGKFDVAKIGKKKEETLFWPLRISLDLIKSPIIMIFAKEL